jgi:hypothetical protein
MRLRQFLDEVSDDAELLSECQSAIARIDDHLRQAEVSRPRLQVLLGVLGGLCLNLLASGVWEVVRPMLEGIVSLLR